MEIREQELRKQLEKERQEILASSDEHAKQLIENYKNMALEAQNELAEARRGFNRKITELESKHAEDKKQMNEEYFNNAEKKITDHKEAAALSIEKMRRELDLQIKANDSIKESYEQRMKELQETIEKVEQSKHSQELLYEQKLLDERKAGEEDAGKRIADEIRKYELTIKDITNKLDEEKQRSLDLEQKHREEILAKEKKEKEDREAFESRLEKERNETLAMYRKINEDSKEEVLQLREQLQLLKIESERERTIAIEKK